MNNGKDNMKLKYTGLNIVILARYAPEKTNNKNNITNFTFVYLFIVLVIKLKIIPFIS